ncbi:hypothetical protein [Enterococcus sp. AZ177]|uniref:hypothetical protein n=1 Tax=unclassified Enterococcus TaxID=2608891 RepID=UPI003D2FDC72
MEKTIDIDNVLVDAGNIKHAISALERFSYDLISMKGMKLDDINELKGLIASIHCIASKHADELEQYCIECDRE